MNNIDNIGEDLSAFFSEEKIPEAWPDEFPGVTRYAAAEPSTTIDFDNGDIALVNNLGNLTPGGFIEEIKAIHAIACKLAVDESQEKTRGKILRVLQ